MVRFSIKWRIYNALHAIRRNPVINGAIVLVIAQVWQDYQLGNIDTAHLWRYFFTMAMGIAIREFTVPAREKRNLEEEYQRLVKAVVSERDDL